jgi:hypothetical protein
MIFESKKSAVRNFGILGILALMILAVVLVSNFISAPSFTSQPGIEGKDAYIDSGQQNRNYGASTTINVNAVDSMRGLIEFNLSGISPTANITNATITLYLSSKGTGANIPVTMRRINSSWIEGTGDGTSSNDGATWNNRTNLSLWASAGGDFDSKVWANVTVSAQDVFYTFDITPLVQNWVNGTYPNYGIIIRADNTNGIWKFASSDDINATRRPKINITYPDTGAPSINDVQLTSKIRENTDFEITTNITDESSVSSVFIDIGGKNYSLNNSGTAGSRTVAIRPSAKGSIETNGFLDYQNVYDQNNNTKAGINSNSILTVKTSGTSASGKINSVKIKLIYSKATYNTTGYVHWAISSGVQGISHAFNSTSDSLTQTEFDVTNERNWTLSDFNLLSEIHINRSNNILRVYEAWFEVNYNASNSPELWSASVNSSNWSIGILNYTIYANDSFGYKVAQTGNFTLAPKLVTVNASIENANGSVQESRIEIVNMANNETELNETISENYMTSVEAGNKKITVTPTNSPIESIEFNNVNASSDLNGFVKIDNPSENGTSLDEIYAIDPTAINFTNALVIVQGSGNSLFKCTNWSFENQTCSGRWKKLADIAPGQEYNFTLTAEDPGFGEGNYSVNLLDENDYLYNYTEAVENVTAELSNVYINVSDSIAIQNIDLYSRNSSDEDRDMLVMANHSTNDTRLQELITIDPENVSFVNMSVTKTAKGKDLLKCTKTALETGRK